MRVCACLCVCRSPHRVFSLLMSIFFHYSRVLLNVFPVLQRGRGGSGNSGRKNVESLKAEAKSWQKSNRK